MSRDPFGALMDANSPIAIFASKPSHQKQPNRLKPVAIQLNSSTGIISNTVKGFNPEVTVDRVV